MTAPIKTSYTPTQTSSLKKTTQSKPQKAFKDVVTKQSAEASIDAPLSEKSIITICSGNKILLQKYYNEILSTDSKEAEKIHPYLTLIKDEFYTIETPLEVFLQHGKLLETEFALQNYNVAYKEMYLSRLSFSYTRRKDFEHAERIANTIPCNKMNFEHRITAEGKETLASFREEALESIKRAKFPQPIPLEDTSSDEET